MRFRAFHIHSMKEALKKHWLTGLVGGLIVVVIIIAIFQQSAQDKPRAVVALPAIGTPASFAKGAVPIITTEALSDLLRQGYSRVIVKLNFTSDDKLVCIGDWNADTARIFGKTNTPSPTLSYADFTTLPTAEGKRPCTLETLSAWMDANPSAEIVIPATKRHAEMFKYLSDNMENKKRRFIPLVHAPGQYKALKKMGYQSIILSYPAKAFKSDKKDAIERLDEFSIRNRVYAVQMPQKAFATNASAKKLAQKNIPIYIFTTNCAALAQLKKFGSIGLYAGPALKSPCSAGAQ